jgi:transposase
MSLLLKANFIGALPSISLSRLKLVFLPLYSPELNLAAGF